MKTRFAPSPTGYIHIGNVRSAIYPYLLAKQEGGVFILRIEDTDRARYVPEATALIEDTLKWLGLMWDEGPEVGGPNGPYFQTERQAIYKEWAEKLLAKKRAYMDPTSSEVIQGYREADNAAKIPYLYRNHRPEGLLKALEGDKEAEKEWFTYREGVPVRFLAEPREREWHDEVLGDLHAGPEVQDDIVLIKADGLPTYNFGHIVDDATMEVTHVMRGVEYLSSTPNYLALYEALDLPVPKLVLLPHILAPTGNKKLGKRDGAKSVTEYRADGILPEAMLNYLANLGWNDGTEQEIYTMPELIRAFSLDRVQNSGARYDETKLLWMNGQWIRRLATGQKDVPGAETDLDAAATAEGIDELSARAEGFWPEEAMSAAEEYRKKVLAIIYDRLKTLGDLKEMTRYFFVEPEMNLEMLTGNKFLKKMAENELVDLLKKAAGRLDEVADWTADEIQGALNELLLETGKKPAELFSLIRIAISFAPFSPALNLTMEVLGKERSLARIRRVANAIAVA